MEQLKKDIQVNFPELSITSCIFLGEGMDSVAVLVNDQLVFRFPKREDTAKQLKAEIALLPKLHSYIDLAIPNFTYIGKRANGLPFVGYLLIAGPDVKSTGFPNIDPAIRDHIVEQIATFIRQVHDFPVDEAKALGVRNTHFTERCTEDLKTLQTQLYPTIEQPLIDYIETLYAGYLDDPANASYTPTLLHSDLSRDHLIYSPEKQELIGVIDFGDIEIGDPDYEFKYLYRAMGKEMIDRLLKYLPHPDPDRLYRKLEFFSHSNVLEDLLTGLKRNDTTLVTAALKEFRKEVGA
jgi:aminoglycoside 2''-phosphotransferase